MVREHTATASSRGAADDPCAPRRRESTRSSGDVRVVMERGSVEGEVFHRGAVSELSPALVRPAVESHLATSFEGADPLDLDDVPADEGFRFRHLLIRDAAYESLPKATRAELHERFAVWLDAMTSSRVTRSSGTTSSRPIATEPSSIVRIRRSLAWRRSYRTISLLRGAEPWTAATSTRGAP